ncbi:hypothetical protein BGLA2_3530002 [Burkholderia gladioli]|nr:hypothetical protein BGLA2_3530002 [Burkholderia gladioli]
MGCDGIFWHRLVVPDIFVTSLTGGDPTRYSFLSIAWLHSAPLVHATPYFNEQERSSWRTH